MNPGYFAERRKVLKAQTLQALGQRPSSCRELAELLLGQGDTRTSERSRMYSMLCRLESAGVVTRVKPQRRSPADYAPDIWHLATC